MDLSLKDNVTSKSMMEDNKVNSGIPIKRSVSWEYKLNQNSFDPSPIGSPPNDIFLNKLMARKTNYFSMNKKLKIHSLTGQSN